MENYQGRMNLGRRGGTGGGRRKKLNGRGGGEFPRVCDYDDEDEDKENDDKRRPD